jgi:hypothetical protein
MQSAHSMETLCKLYLELANVVPADCISSREKECQKHIDRYGIALMMIAEGCSDPRKVAADAINSYLKP